MTLDLIGQECDWLEECGAGGVCEASRTSANGEGELLEGMWYNG